MADEPASTRRRERLRRGRGGPETPAEVSGRLGVLKRTFQEFREDKMTDWAASLTYYGVLSLFPALIAFLGIVGFFADPRSVSETITSIVSSLGPASAADTFAEPISSIASSDSTSGIMALVGIGAALWSASGYVGAFVRASNMIYETPEGRPFWKLRPLQILVTLVMLLLALVVVLALILTGPVVEAVAAPHGLGETATTLWQYGKWPVLLAVVMTMIAVLYYAAPNVKQPGFRWATPGSIFAVVVWLLASAAFAFYVANFGSYSETYGSLGGVVVFLVWLWITNNAILLGAQLNSELERSRELEAGVPGAEYELQAEPRDEPKEAATAGTEPRDAEAGDAAAKGR